MDLRRVGRLWSSRNGSFATLLTAQIDVAESGARVVHRALTDDVDWSTARNDIAQLEHQGDAIRAELVHLLGRSLVTPLDREDLFRVSRSFDDVLDNLRDLVREGEGFRPEQTDVVVPVVAALIEALTAIRGAVDGLENAPAQIASRALNAKKAINGVRRSYGQQLGLLFAGDLSMDTLKVRELLRRLDVAGLRLGEAADALSDA
jgi:uncharacterized protein Yka (UPF0111/DUF47 family)